MTKQVNTMEISILIQDGGISIYKSLRSIEYSLHRAKDEGIDVVVKLKYNDKNNYSKNTLTGINQFFKKFPHAMLKQNTRLRENTTERMVRTVISTDILIGEDFLCKSFIHAKDAEKSIFFPEYLIKYKLQHSIHKLPTDPKVFPFTLLIEKSIFPAVATVSPDVKILDFTKEKIDCWYADCVAENYTLHSIDGTLACQRIETPTTDDITSTKIAEPHRYLKLYNEFVDTFNDTPVPTKKSDNLIFSKIRKHLLLEEYVRTQVYLHKKIYLKVINKIHKPVSLEGVSRSYNEKQSFIRTWGMLNEIEPMVRASSDMLHLIPYEESYTNLHLIHAYAKFCEKFKDRKIDCVVLVPHLVRGGADLTAINLAKSLSKQGKNILVVTTIQVDSPWRSIIEKIPNVYAIEYNNELKYLSREQLTKFILSIVKGWGVNNLSIINSEIGYRLATDYRNILTKNNCKVHLHTYAYDMTDDGYLYNVIPDGLVDAYNGIDEYITDSRYYADQLITINGFESDKVSTLYQPIDTFISPKKNYRRTNKILWASRVCDAKLVTVMVDIGTQLAEHNIELHVFGAMDDNYKQDGRFHTMIGEHHTIIYHGKYDGFGSIDVTEYDMFLMTTKNEGMPNVILEACSADIFIVAPNVGGISECILNRKNGRIVEDKFSADDYVKNILSAYDDEEFNDLAAIQSANAKIIDRHSWATYDSSVKDLLSR